MKGKSKILGIIAMILAMVGTLVTTVSATAVGEGVSWGGVQIGWVLFGLAVLLIVGGYFFVKEKVLFKKVAVIGAAFLIVGVFCFVDVTPPTADVTPSILWSVSTTVDAGNVTTDDDARTITIMYYRNTSKELINQTDSTIWVVPIINFTIAPTQTVGLVDTSLAATTTSIVNNPDREFTEDTTTYDLFTDASGENKKDLVWTADGTDDYESRYCTVPFGSSETVLLTITFLDDGLSIVDIGDSYAFTLAIGGITYTATIMCVGDCAATHA